MLLMYQISKAKNNDEYLFLYKWPTDDVHLSFRTLQNIHFKELLMLREIYILNILANGIMFPGAEKDFLFEKMA